MWNPGGAGGGQVSCRLDLWMSRAGVNAAIDVDAGTKNSRSSLTVFIL